MRSARRVSSAIRSNDGTCTLNFAIAAIAAVWGKHWKVPPRSGSTIACRRDDVIRSTRLPSACSTATPGRALAAPGPLLAMQTPSLAVSRAYAPAMCTALVSWRGVMRAMS